MSTVYCTVPRGCMRVCAATTVFYLSMGLFFLVFQASLGMAASKGIAIRLKKGNTSEEQVELYRGGSYALIVGESNYSGGWPRLEAVGGELDKVEEVLRGKGFTITRKDNLKARELEGAFRNFIDEFGYHVDNRLIFYYSGHGHTRMNNEKGYLVPVDAPNPDDHEKLFLKKALPMSQILSWSRRIEAKHVLFLFDSCFSGTIFKTKALPKTPPAISRAVINPVRQFITAGSAGEMVPARSVFTPAFVDALGYGWGDLNKDGYVSGTELGLYLQGKVPQHTSQFPQYGKISDYSLSRGDFIFLAGGTPEYIDSNVPSTIRKDSKTATIKVTSKPSKGLVRIDGKSVGETPIHLGSIRPGKVRITIEKTGFKHQEKNTELKAGKRTVINFDLVEAQRNGWLMVAAKPLGARVLIHNVGPYFKEGMALKAGKYHIEVTARGYIKENRWIELSAGDEMYVEFILKQLGSHDGSSLPQDWNDPYAVARAFLNALDSDNIENAAQYILPKDRTNFMPILRRGLPPQFLNHPDINVKTKSDNTQVNILGSQLGFDMLRKNERWWIVK